MAKINISFNNQNYTIDEASFAAAYAKLQSHLTSVMNGSGAKVSLNGVSYNIDSTKLSAATNNFISHLGKIAGTGSKVVVNGTEYPISSTKIAEAINNLHTVLGGLHDNGGGNEGSEPVTPVDPALNPSGIIPEGGQYTTDGATYNAGAPFPATVKANDVYIYGDYKYTALNALSWSVSRGPGVSQYEQKYGAILESVNNAPVTKLNETFKYCSYMLSAPTIPDSVTTIGPSTFEQCRNLKSIIIPDSVTFIGNSAFASCISLTSVTIPDSVTVFDKYAFLACSGLTSITISGNTKYIYQQAFSGCSSLTSIILPDTLTRIDYKAFSGCSNLMSITFEGSVDQWNVIKKDTYWRNGLPATEVVCCDGTVSLS